MNKKNKVSKLNRDHSHRKALLNNLVISLFTHERIESSLAKLKAARSFAEKLITRAKENVSLPDDEKGKLRKIHNKRQVNRFIKDPVVLTKLFDDIAPRYKERNGGYTRIYKLVNRISDNTEVGLLELVDRKSKDTLKSDILARREKSAAYLGRSKKPAEKPKAEKATKSKK